MAAAAGSQVCDIDGGHPNTCTVLLKQVAEGWMGDAGTAGSLPQRGSLCGLLSSVTLCFSKVHQSCVVQEYKNQSLCIRIGPAAVNNLGVQVTFYLLI